ncbi:hypothetical protein MUK60_07580 [Streptomyces sp. LRE541]|uniref:hypothetical protein n=1 Tax=Streptomyces sp. LRE541 TaxID=2931983 RepID=UPI00200DE634|nr:hypothetical protein [Streptomyces sp. LRE541]UPZ27694.1 hypothetical protein MUK60_07580 [Streptomyces sp. LRE541]
MTHVPPTADQLRVIADRAHKGPLATAEILRLREGIDRLAEAGAHSRRSRRRTASGRLRALRRRLRALHAPMIRGGVEICSECSGWNGIRCLGLVTPYPCPTIDAVDASTPTASNDREENAA